jgi:hypothetical protein
LSLFLAGAVGTAGEPEAASSNDAVMLFPIVKDGKWGYMDESGTVKIAPQYDQAFDFYEGLACVVKYPWRGFIDATGAMVIEPKFSWAGRFREGFAPINSTTMLYGGHANYYKSPPRVLFIDRTGEVQKHLQASRDGVHDGLVVTYRKHVFDTEGKKLGHDADEVGVFSGGLAPARKKKLWGYLDHSMKWAIEPRFDLADGFSDGMAAVGTLTAEAKENMKKRRYGARDKTWDYTWGFIDRTGAVVIESKYENAWRFSEGLASVCSGGKWGYIDKEGTMVIPPAYDYAWPFSEGMGRILVGEKQGFVSREGKLVVEPRYKPAWEFSKGLARVIDEEKREGYIDTKGEYVWEPTR